MKTFHVLLVVFIVACNNPKKPTPINTNNEYVSELEHRKDEIKKFSVQNRSNMIVLAKIPNQKLLVKVENNKWPEDTECAYNILKDKKGRIIMILSSPTSESGDWYFESANYFDKEGRTFIYEIKANQFELPDDGVAYETTTKYFETNFKLIKLKYKLVDKDGKKLDKKTYGFDAESNGFDIRVYPNVKECLRAYHIQLSK